MQSVSRIRLEHFLRVPCWEALDEMVCELEDRLRMLGYKHILEVELRADIVGLGGGDHHEKFLLRFKVEGRVKVVVVSSGRFQEWP